MLSPTLFIMNLNKESQVSIDFYSNKEKTQSKIRAVLSRSILSGKERCNSFELTSENDEFIIIDQGKILPNYGPTEELIVIFTNLRSRIESGLWLDYRYHPIKGMIFEFKEKIHLTSR